MAARNETARSVLGALGGRALRGFSPQRLASVLVMGMVALLVLYPLFFLATASFNAGSPRDIPPTEYGLSAWRVVAETGGPVVWNTVRIAAMSTVVAIPIGFTLAWIVYRTKIPGRAFFAQAFVLPYYVTPLVGALAWMTLASPRSGFINQIWFRLTGATSTDNWLVNIETAGGIAFVMALFEGAVAFVMISAAMRSMDPALEESSQVFGASRLMTIRRVTLPLLRPAVIGASIFVFAEMLGAFAAPFLLGQPKRVYTITTSIYTELNTFPPNYPRAAALGITLFFVMFVMMFFYQRMLTKNAGSFVTVSGKAFRPRPMDMGRATVPLFIFSAGFFFLAILLPLATLVLSSFQAFATAFLQDATWTTMNYERALGMAPIRLALFNSLRLGFFTASAGILLFGYLTWLIYRSDVPKKLSKSMEYIAMFPLAVPRMVFGLALLWAWLIIPFPIYGTLWLLWLAYLTVLLPLGIRTIAGVVLQIDKSLEECARVCGAGRAYQLRTVTMPLMKPGLIAAWLLIFIASVRELGASIMLQGPNSRVIGPSIVEAFAGSGKTLTSAMALLQMAAVAIALVLMFFAARKSGREDVNLSM